jgi:hypothetical protein
MTKRRAAVFFSTLVMAGLAGLIATTIYRWSSPLCGNTPIVEEPAPGGKFRAVVFERDCGATTGFSTNISIIPARSPLPNQQGNVFRADHPTTPAGPVTQIRWQSEHELFVTYDSAAHIALLQSRLGELAIRFQPQTKE